MTNSVVEAVGRRITEELERRGAKFKHGEWWFHCIAHVEKTPSAAWNPEKCVWHCHGCGAGGKARDLGMRLGLDAGKSQAEERKTVYLLRDTAGTVVAEKVRLDLANGGKKCLWRRNGRNGLGGMHVEELPLYGCHEVAKVPNSIVVVCEGEKAAGALIAKGLVAVGTVTGAASCPNLDAWRVLVGHDVILWPDEDAPGYEHMARAAENLRQVGVEPRAMTWTDAPEKGDAFDWFVMGRTVEELRELIAAAPPWTLPATGADEHREHATTEGEYLTDLGNARRLVRLHGADLRFSYATRSWFVWTGTHWAKDADAEVMRRAKDTVEQMYHEAVGKHDEERTNLLRHAMRSQTAAKLRDMVTVAESEPGIPIDPSDLDADPGKLNVLNGTIDLRTGRLHLHRREDYITKVAPVTYDSNARHPVWDRFLNEATGGDADLAAFLQRAVGYSLTGDVSEEVFFFVHGPQAAGKSTFIEAVKATLGDYAATADFETFLARPQVGGVRSDVARLDGARFVSSIEVDEGKKLAEGLVKTLTGGDAVTARFLYQKEFTFKPQFKLWLAANHAPKVGDGDEAMWRRILRVPFECTVPKDKRDPQLKKMLTDPAIAGPAILAWAVAGCLAWQRERLGVPPVVERATEDYRREMDVLSDFYVDRCIFTAEAWARSSDLRGTYETWARENGERVIGLKEFWQRLVARGCANAMKKERGRQFRIWRGIGLLDEEGVTGDGRVTAGLRQFR